MSSTKNQAIENQKLKLENEQLKTLVNCLQSQVHDLIIESAEEEPSLVNALKAITPDPDKRPKSTKVRAGVLTVGDTVIYCVSRSSLYVGTVSDINDVNQVFFEDALFLQFNGQLRLIKHGKDCCIGDAVAFVFPKHIFPNPKN